jgi:hypothetical protein
MNKKIPKSIVEESSSYDNFINQKVDIDTDGKLPIEMIEERNEREKLWVGMPEFIQEENPSFKTIYVHFRNEEDFKEFVTKYKNLDTDQVISPKTKSMWYPHLDKDENSLKRYFEG